MPAFLVLLPLTLSNLLVGLLLVSNPQTTEYVRYISDISFNAIDMRFGLQVAVHLLAYAAMCFALVATVHTVSSRLSAERHPLLRQFQALVEIAFVALPSALLAG